MKVENVKIVGSLKSCIFETEPFNVKKTLKDSNQLVGSVDPKFNQEIYRDIEKFKIKPFKNYIAILTILIFGLSQKNEAQTGKIDLTFNSGATGANGVILTTPIQTDGKIILGGDFTSYNGSAKNRLIRVNSNGTIDATFNIGTGADGLVNKVLIQTDNKLIAVGLFNKYNATNRKGIVRINSNGSLDATFDPGNGANGDINSASLQANGKIIVAGGFNKYDNTTRNRIARVNTNGSLDATFNPSPAANSTIYATAIQPDGKIIAAGAFTQFNGSNNFRLVRLSSTGTIDATFTTGLGVTGASTNTAVRACNLQSDGKLVIGGLFESYNGNARNNITRLNTDGSIDLSFNIGTGANNTVNSITIQSDGKIIIGGEFTSYNGTLCNHITRLNSNGTIDNTFKPDAGPNNAIFSTTLQTDDKLIVGGIFISYDGISTGTNTRLLMTCSTVTTSISAQNNIRCNGLNDGSALISAIGGSNHTYSWSPSGGSASTASGLSAGEYTCVTKNDCENSGTSLVTITEPNPLSLSVSSNTTVCVGGSISSSALATGGIGPISFNWMPGNLSGSSQIITPTTTTVYSVTATDANNCTARANQTVTTVNCTQFIPGSCGATLTTLDQRLTFYPVPGATNYRLEIMNAQQPFCVSNVRYNNLTSFKMSWVPGIQYGRTYSVRIAAYVSGAWQCLGNACSITTPPNVSIPTTQFSAGNVTLSTLDQQLNFPLVLGATNYKLQITNASQPLNIVNVRFNTVSYFKMAWVKGIQYGRTYDVKISAYVNDTWQPYGNISQITTPSTIPSTQLVAGSCGATVGSLSQIFNFEEVSGAVNYKVEVINSSQSLNVINYRDNNLTTFALSYIAGTQPGRTYDIRVAANVGGIWSEFGPMCQVTVGLANNKKGFSESGINQNPDIFINLFPNPTNGEINIESSESVKAIMVYNISGELIANEENINRIDLSNYANGFYIIHVKTETGIKFFRIIKE